MTFNLAPLFSTLEGGLKLYACGISSERINIRQLPPTPGTRLAPP